MEINQSLDLRKNHVDYKTEIVLAKMEIKIVKDKMTHVNDMIKKAETCLDQLMERYDEYIDNK